MDVPSFQKLFWPSLNALNDGKEHSINEIFESASKSLNLPDEIVNVKMKNMNTGVVRYRTKLGTFIS